VTRKPVQGASRHQGRPKPAGQRELSTAVGGVGGAPTGPTFQGSPDPLTSWLPRRRIDLVAGLIVAALAFLAFVNSLWNGFASDDIRLIQDNPQIRHLSNLRDIFAEGNWPWRGREPLYRPLTIFSFAVNYAVAGVRPLTYHLVNVLLHAGNSALVYRIIAALFKAPGLALVAAAVFALHPIHTEAVANTVGRSELLANTFLFLSWWWYLKWEQRANPAKTRWLIGSLAAFALALFSKEHAVVLPALLVLSDLLRASQRSLPLRWIIQERSRTAYIWYLPPLAGFLLVRFLALGQVLTSTTPWVNNPLAHADLWTRVLTAIKVLGRYLWLFLFPVRLSSDYSYNQIPVSRSLFEPAVLAALLALMVLCFLAAVNWRRDPTIGLGVAIFAVTILPVSNLLFPIGTIMGERLLYLPSLGLCLLLGVAVTTVAARPRWSLLGFAAFGMLFLGYGARTVVRNRDWHNNAAIVSAAARASPNSTTAHAYFGSSLLVRGDLSGARKEFERSLEIYPGFGRALVGLGRVLQRQGRIDEAVQVYRRVERGDVFYGRAHVNLGFIALQQGQPEEALLEFREVAARGPFGPRETNELAEGFFKLGYLTEAQTILEAARQATPHLFYIRENLALVYRRQGRREDAQRELEEAARLKSNSR
jgi:Flp pilus assembly protein TadD